MYDEDRGYFGDTAKKVEGLIKGIADLAASLIGSIFFSPTNPYHPLNQQINQVALPSFILFTFPDCLPI